MGYRWMKLEAGGLKVSDDRSGREVTISRGEGGLEVYAGHVTPEAVVSNLASATVLAMDFMRHPALVPFNQAA